MNNIRLTVNVLINPFPIRVFSAGVSLLYGTVVVLLNRPETTMHFKICKIKNCAFKKLKIPISNSLTHTDAKTHKKHVVHGRHPYTHYVMRMSSMDDTTNERVSALYMSNALLY